MTAQPLETVVLPRVTAPAPGPSAGFGAQCRAIQLKLQGLTYQQIADELGYTSRGTVYKIIKTAQAAQLTGAVEEHLDIEVSRLNALQAADSMRALLGVQTMLAKPSAWTWHEYWDRLADRVSPLQWWEVGEVDDESYGYELLYHLETCHPRSIEYLDPKYPFPDPEGTTGPDRS